MAARRLAEPGAVAAGAVLLVVVLTWPLVPRFDRIGRVNTGDGQFAIWNVAWVAHALTTDASRLFHANIFYPHRYTLAYSEANIGAGTIAIPVWLATKNPYAAHNSVVIVGFIASLVGAYLLARYLTGHAGAAAFCAVAFAFAPYIYARTAHIQLLMTAGLPFGMLALHRLVDRPSASRSVVLGLALFAQAMTCAYYGLFAGLMVGLAVLFYALARGLWRQWRYWLWVVVAAAVSVGLVAPFFLPYAEIQRDVGFAARTLDHAAHWSADWRAWLASPAWAHRWMLPLLGTWKEVLFPGFLTTVLGLAGLVVVAARRSPEAITPTPRSIPVSSTAHRPRETAVLYGLIAVMAFWISFGPKAGLYTVLYHYVPAFELLRAPARVGIVVSLALAVGAALALARLTASWHPRNRLVAPLALTAVLALEVAAVPLPIPRVDPYAVNNAYRVLANERRGGVVEFPFFYHRIDWHRHTRYMLSSTAHWQPLINGYSDHFPQDFRDEVMHLSTFPSRAAFEKLRKRRARFVVIHLRLYDRRSREKVVEALDAYRAYLRPLSREDDVWLYEIVAWPR